MSSNFVTLICPNCGGKLEISEDTKRFASAYCGVEHYVNRERGKIYLEPIINTLNKIEKHTDIVVSELAIKRLRNEIEEIEEKWADEMRWHKQNLANVGVFGLFLKISGKSKQEYDRINDKYQKVIKQKLAEIEKHKRYLP